MQLFIMTGLIFDEKALVNGVKVFTCAAVDLLMESALDPAFLERDRLRKIWHSGKDCKDREAADQGDHSVRYSGPI